MKSSKPKPKEPKPSNRPKPGLAAALEAIQKIYGSRPLFSPPTRRYIPMRYQALARLLGGDDHPGLPTGSVIEVVGPEHSGKTTLAYAMIDAVLNQPEGTTHMVRTDQGVREALAPRRALYLDFEHALDLKYLTACTRNVNLLRTDDDGKPINVADANLWIMQPDVLEDGVEVAIQLIGSGEFGVIVIDSIPAMLPREEMEKTMDQSTVGKLPQAIGKMFRRIIHLLGKNNVVLVLVNQWRDKIGVSFGDPRYSPGGKALGHFDSIKLDVGGPRRSDWFPQPPEGPGGKTCTIAAKKNKVTGLLTKCEYQLGSDVGISAEVEISLALEALGLVKLSHTNPSLPVTLLPGLPKQVKFKNRAEFFRTLRTGKKLYESLLRMCLEGGATFNSPRPTNTFGDD